MARVAGPKGPTTPFGQPILPNLNVRQLCPNCRADPPNIIEEYSAGDLVCGDCGTILGDRIVDTRSEWRNFAGDENGDDPSRVGSAGNPLLAAHFTTEIGNLGGGRNNIARDLQRAQSRVESANNGQTSQAALASAFSRIKDRCDTMNLSSAVTARAQHVYKLADERKVVRGKKDQAVLAACIIIACRDSGVDRSYSEICKIMRVSKKELGQTFTLIKSAVQRELQNGGVASTQNSIESMIRRFANLLGLEHAVNNVSNHVNNQASKKTNIDGRSPLSIAAGVLWFTCILMQKPITIRDVARIAEVSESTIKLITKMVAHKLDDVIRPEWKEQFPAGYEQLLLLHKASTASALPSRSGTPAQNSTSTSGEPPMSASSNGSSSA